MVEIKSLATCTDPNDYEIPAVGCVNKDVLMYAGIAGIIGFILTRH